MEAGNFGTLLANTNFVPRGHGMKLAKASLVPKTVGMELANTTLVRSIYGMLFAMSITVPSLKPSQMPRWAISIGMGCALLKNLVIVH